MSSPALSQGAATFFQLEAVAMTNDSSPQVRLILCDNEGVGRITVGLEAFFEFSFSLAEDLQDLVAQHENSSMSERSGTFRVSVRCSKSSVLFAQQPVDRRVERSGIPGSGQPERRPVRLRRDKRMR